MPESSNTVPVRICASRWMLKYTLVNFWNIVTVSWNIQCQCKLVLWITVKVEINIGYFMKYCEKWPWNIWCIIATIVTNREIYSAMFNYSDSVQWYNSLLKYAVDKIYSDSVFMLKYTVYLGWKKIIWWTWWWLK